MVAQRLFFWLLEMLKTFVMRRSRCETSWFRDRTIWTLAFVPLLLRLWLPWGTLCLGVVSAWACGKNCKVKQEAFRRTKQPDLLSPTFTCCHLLYFHCSHFAQPVFSCCHLLSPALTHGNLKEDAQIEYKMQSNHCKSRGGWCLP